MIDSKWADFIVGWAARLFYACAGLYERVVLNYGVRDAMLIFFGAFALITFVLARGEIRRKLSLGKSGFGSPFAFMTAKAFEGAGRFCASIALVLGLFAMAQYQRMI
ncbi:MAG: hypothetical protein U1E28_21630 [Beijerinckiaceae bacterium]